MAAKRKPVTGTRPWVRLGELLQERRTELDPDWYSRQDFAVARGVNLKLVQDIERNDRENITPPTLSNVIAPAYGVTYESIRAVLEEVPGADLEAAPGGPPRRRGVVRDFPARSPRLADGSELAFGAETARDAAPFAVEIWELLDGFRAQGTDPETVPGEQLFPGDQWSAQRWDDNGGAGLTLRERVTLAAVLRARRAKAERGGRPGLSG